jgi:uncharacterized protein
LEQNINIKQIPYIHKFKTPYNYYIYDVNTNSIIKINKELYEFDFEKHDEKFLSDNSKQLLHDFKELNLLSANKISAIEHPESEFLHSMLDRKVNAITLQVTQQCNLRCSYCVYSGNYNTRSHQNLKMDIDIAKRSIDFLIAHSIDSPLLSIGFYGGEPLLEFELIKECMIYASSCSRGKEISYNITTNGTLLTKEIIDFFIQYDVNITVSLDGDKDSHDKNRIFSKSGKGSFDVIKRNLIYIKNTYPDFYEKITFNIVLDPTNDFEVIDDFFNKDEMVKDSIINADFINENYAIKKFQRNEKFFIMRNYEIFKMYLIKLNILDKGSISNLISDELEIIKNSIANRYMEEKLPEKCHHGGPCIPGVQKLFVNVKGDFYPCERVSEKSEVMKIGNIKDGFYINKARKILNVGKITEKTCRNCWAFRFCGLCCAYADNINDLSASIKLKNCDSVKRFVEKNLKCYAMLKEFNYDFEN